MQCLMASQSRIDDDRMLVFKKRNGAQEYTGRSIAVIERELLMGLPQDYVGKQGLYSLIFENFRYFSIAQSSFLLLFGSFDSEKPIFPSLRGWVCE